MSDSMDIKKSSSKKKTIQPLTIEDVYNEVSIVSASNLNPPMRKMVLTPRSAKTCLQLGINPELLKIRDLDSFWEMTIDPTVQRMRHEAYIQRRHDLMKQCRNLRKQLINAEFENPLQPAPETMFTSDMLMKQQQEQTSSLIKMELLRIEKMQKRQEKELEQMIQHEIYQAKVQQEMAEKLDEEKRQEELKKKRREKRLRIMAEERRLRDLQRAAMEESEEEQRRQMAREMHERERKLAEITERKKEETKLRLRMEEAEKKRINEEHRRQLQEYFENEKKSLRQKLETMQIAEKKKQDALLDRQKELADKLKIKRKLAEERIDANIKMSLERENIRKKEFIDKQQQHESKREYHLAKLKEERDLQLQESELQEQRRQMILLQQKEEEQQKSELLLTRFHQQDEHLGYIMKEKQKENEILKEKKLIRLEIKKENFDRVNRVQEFSKLSVLKKIEDTDTRVKTMLEQRRQLIADRRRAASQTKRQKEMIAHVMDEIRTNATKSSTLVADAIAGKISASEIAKGSLGDLSTLGSVKKGSKSKKNRTTSDLLGFSRTKSAGNMGNTDNSFDSDNDNGFSMSQENMLNLHKKTSFLTDDAEPVPYKSPYDMPMISKGHSR